MSHLREILAQATHDIAIMDGMSEATANYLKKAYLDFASDLDNDPWYQQLKHDWILNFLESQEED